jgi:diguanylate cyclase (GGDEF)-like protein
MPAKIPGDAAFELKLVFLRELDSGYVEARDCLNRLLRKPGDKSPQSGLCDFFHRIAGTANAVDLVVLAHLASVCERAGDLVSKGLLAPEEAVHLFSEGLAGVASVLESHRSLPAEPRSPAPALEHRGLVQPGINSEERVLSKILVVDDDPFSAGLIDNCLRNAGFVSSYCCEPTKAMEIIRSELPDLIILDVVMPEIDGFDLCRQVRSHPAMQLTPVIFVTRKGDVEQRVAGLAAGGNDYIAKPFEPMELVARVRTHLQNLAALRDLAIRDGLTRCYNHKFFRMRLEQEMARSHRYESSLSFGLMDIDHFKAINDTWGHPAGDLVLAELASLTVASLRSTDLVARYGGDEFAFLLIESGAPEGQLVATRLRDSVAGRRVLLSSDPAKPAVQIPVTVSVGVTSLSKEDTLEGLVQRADQALSSAKAAGRNQVKLNP